MVNFFMYRGPENPSSNFSFRQTSGQEELSTKDVFELINQQNTGIRELWSYVDPVWKFSDEELVEFMAQRIVYETGFL